MRLDRNEPLANDITAVSLNFSQDGEVLCVDAGAHFDVIFMISHGQQVTALAHYVLGVTGLARPQA